MEKKLDGKVAIVTGAGRGIGRSIALSLARNGVRVSLAARTENELNNVRSEIEAFGGVAAAFPADISSEADCISLVRKTVERFNRLDILLNNAGIGVFRPLVETTTLQWDQLMAVNARGPFILCREAVPYLKIQDHSFIINISSVAGVKGYINQSIYSASKHALMGMTKALAREVQGEGIRVHVICSGGVDTDLVNELVSDENRPLMMRTEDIADIVMFLLTRNGNGVIDEIHVRRATSIPWL